MIITIQNLKWSNWFSYGIDNYINFDQPVLQVMGLNGAGKTSIPLILQEVYYGKNSKGKKKASLVNRYLEAPVLEAESNFIDDIGNNYKIVLARKSSLKLKLFKNGEDISSHTTTNTYKTIQEIIGLDFSTFSQLIYQSSTDKLDFLTATDANRKKFLINLFTLNKYLDIQENFKTASSKLSTELVALTSKISTIDSWIKKHSAQNLTELEIQELPELNQEDIATMAEIMSSIKSIAETNKKINSNNTYKDLMENLDTSDLCYEGKVDLSEKKRLTSSGVKLKEEKVADETRLKILNSNILKIHALGDKCHSCGQDIPEDLKESMLWEIRAEEDLLVSNCIELNDSLIDLRASLLEISKVEKKIRERETVSLEFTRLTNSIDESLPDNVLEEKDLRSDLLILNTKVKELKKSIASISESNTNVSAHNSKIQVIIEQLSSHNEDIGNLRVGAFELENVRSKLEILKKAFSPNGLLSYKLDYLVTDLEEEINKYLGVLSSGKFQLTFKLENEKLDIKIVDEGINISIEELSAGELARINAATLLAIRKLMAAISSTKINILFLDEIMGVLDENGKEMLIEVLHNEKDLSTLLVSHEYSHPLIPKITVVKENKVSKIENE